MAKIEKVHCIVAPSSAANKYRVPVKQWRRWDERARAVFNGVFQEMKDNQYNFLHPKQDLLSAQKWRTVAWNAAWIAAGYATT